MGNPKWVLVYKVCVRKEKGVDGLGIVEGRVLYKWEEVHKEKCWDQI